MAISQAISMKGNGLLMFFGVSGHNDPAISTTNWGTIESRKCPVCGRSTEIPRREGLEAIVRGSGKKWPDIMGVSDGLVIHERVLTLLKEHLFTGFKEHEIKIIEIKNKALRNLPTPRYYLLEVLGKVDVDLTEVDDQGGSVCPICFSRNPNPNSQYWLKPKRLIPQMSTWDGSDFVKTRNLRTLHNYCTKRFIDLACEHKWTNFLFGGSMPDITLRQKAAEGRLSYQDPDWFAKLSEQVKAKHPDLFS